VTRRKRITAALQWLFITAVLVFITVQIVRQRAAVGAALTQIGALGIVGSLAATVAGLAATGVAWRMLLAGLGHRLDAGAAAGIFFVAQLGKYLPGSVWPYVAQARIGRAHGVPASRSAAAGAVFVLLHCATGAIVAAALLPLAGDETIQRRFGWLPWLIPLFVVALHPRVIRAGLAQVHRLTRRGSPPPVISWGAMAGALGALLVAWICYGLALFALVAPLAETSGRALLLSTGGFALAWTAGFVAAAVLVVAAPAGLGVREVALYSVLAPVLSGGAATAVVVVSRVGQIAGDVLWAAAAGVWSRRRGAPEDRAAEPADAAVD
jgi:hypothetical protein